MLNIQTVVVGKPTQYEYGLDNLPEKTTLNNGKEVTYTYDTLGRLTGKVLNTATPLNFAYTYEASDRGSGYTTTKIETETIGNTKYKYTYDNYGNIEDIYRVNSNNTETLLCSYVYDSHNQLTTVNDYEHSEQTTYTYNQAGNISRRNHYQMNSSWVATATLESVRYVYGDSEWKDLLTTYNGQTITYDAIGNPLSYRDGISLTWQKGRKLASYSDASNNITYTYDASGMRTGKTVTSGSSTVEWEYVYEGGKLLQMKRGSRILDFSYDASGTPVSIAYRTGATATPIYYYYGVNSRGDVVALYNSTGAIVAFYEYDAYGKLISVENSAGVAYTSETHIANLNPLRYRGYVYDNETGFYYLQTRYYDPTTCRFINADGYCSTGQDINGYNMYAYCNNNPVLYLDSKGCRPIVGDSVQRESKTERMLSCAYMNNTKVYTSIDQAATVAGISAATQTSKDNLEHAYATYSIGTIGNTSYYMNGSIIDGKHDSVNPYDDGIIKVNLVALTHSHPYCNGHVPNEFSIFDPQTGMIYGDAYVAYDLEIPVFLAAPNGTLQVLFWRDDSLYQGIICEDLPVDNEIFICN